MWARHRRMGERVAASGQGLHYSNARGREVRDPILEAMDDSGAVDFQLGDALIGPRRILAVDRGQLMGDSVGRTVGYIGLPDPLVSREPNSSRGRNEPKCPFRIEVAQPQAYSFDHLCKVAGVRPSGLAAAAPNGKKLVLLVHGITPFYKAGESPTGAIGMGYLARADNPGSGTVDWFPNTETIPAVQISQKLAVGIKASGHLALDMGAIGAVAKAVGLEPPTADVRASTDQQFTVAVDIRLSPLKVQSGPIGAGGVAWNLYRQNERIDVYQQLLQTVLVPRDATTLNLRVTTWIRWSCHFLGFGARQWKGRAHVYVVELPSE